MQTAPSTVRSPVSPVAVRSRPVHVALAPSAPRLLSTFVVDGVRCLAYDATDAARTVRGR